MIEIKNLVKEFKSENVYYFGAVLLSLSALGYVGYLIYNRSQKRVRIQRMKEKQANQQKA